jgi:hypothetical protein
VANTALIPSFNHSYEDLEPVRSFPASSSSSLLSHYSLVSLPFFFSGNPNMISNSTNNTRSGVPVPVLVLAPAHHADEPNRKI